MNFSSNKIEKETRAGYYGISLIGWWRLSFEGEVKQNLNCDKDLTDSSLNFFRGQKLKEMSSVWRYHYAQ